MKTETSTHELALLAYAKQETGEPGEVRETNWGTWSSTELPGEYLVLTDKEADEKTGDDIRDSLWAFNPNFLAGYLPEGVSAEMLKPLQDKCEGANPLILALVGDRIADLIGDAIAADGRGHFLSRYDGEENEVEINGEYYYVYRTN